MLSESDESSVEDDKINEAEDRVNSRFQSYGKLFMRQQCSEQEQINSVLWESSLELEEPKLMKTKKSKLKNEFKNYFDISIDSLVAFLPYSFW